MRQRTLKIALVIFLVVFVSVAHAEWRPEEAPKTVPDIKVLFAQKADLEVDREMRSLEWRCVGPFVGVRGCGVAMHPTDKNRFYHAHSSGGGWMTEDNGLYWLPITDGQINVGPVGAIALAPSNPDTICIGTGEPQLRDCSTWGDGAYKSIDGGKTWKQRSGTKDDFHDMAFDPKDPDRMIITHDGGAMVTRNGGKTWSGPYTQPNQQVYRINWHSPIVIDPFDPETRYTAAEVVFRTKDRGQSWEIVSPELTKDDPEKQQPGGSPSSMETSGQEAYNTIHRMAASKVKKGVLWTGSDDGLVYVTQDNCKTWQNVTPPDMLEDSDVYEI